MLAELPVIPPARLLFVLLPLSLVIAVYVRWSLKALETSYAVARMLVQLLLLGYILMFLLDKTHPVLIALTLTVMLLAAGWISLRATKDYSRGHYLKVLASIALGGGLTLLLVTQGVLALQPWFDPRKVIPLGGMAFAGAMNAVALASERLAAETRSGVPYLDARRWAMSTAMIPNTNALLAVGLVNVPGVMTGQVLANADPLIAARYQIMVMAMVFSSAGLSVAAYLMLMRPADDDADA